MANTTIVKDFVKVEGVNPKANSKFRTAGGLLVNGGWINVAQGLDMATFEKGGTYEVELSINEKGYKTLTKVFGLDDAPKAAPQDVPDTRAAREVTKIDTSKSSVFGKRDNSMEAGGIYHDAVALAVGIGVTGLTEDEAIRLVNSLAVKLLTGKRELQG